MRLTARDPQTGHIKWCAPLDTGDLQQADLRQRTDLATARQRVIEDLTYASYRYNRTQAPAIPPERWRAVFVEADKLEQRYQAERTGDQLMHDLDLLV